MSASVAALRTLLEQRFPDAAPLTKRSDAVATGVSLLDKILPGGGLPRGKLTTWTPHGGATAILRAAAQTTLAHGERAAWIDGALMVPGAYWNDGPVLLRPTSRVHALRAAEELLRSGGFALVVLSGVESEGTETVRLTRLARDGGSALVTQTTKPSLATLRVVSRILPHSYRWRRTPFGDAAEVQLAVVQVRARALGWNAHTEFPMPVLAHELRLSLDPMLADRRGIGSAK
ncbi:MAG: hypothetical protein NVS4B3_15170 [Gemmatimonadaceae bacterium]